MLLSPFFEGIEVKMGANILISGPSGCGKSLFLMDVAQRALESDFKVILMLTDNLSHEFLQEAREFGKELKGKGLKILDCKPDLERCIFEKLSPMDVCEEKIEEIKRSCDENTILIVDSLTGFILATVPHILAEFSFTRTTREALVAFEEEMLGLGARMKLYSLNSRLSDGIIEEFLARDMDYLLKMFEYGNFWAAQVLSKGYAISSKFVYKIGKRGIEVIARED